MSNIEQKLKELGITLPEAAKPAANYVSYVVSGNQIIISGQIPVENGSFEQHTGKVGKDVDINRAKEIAKICAINVLSQAKDAAGSLDKVKCLRLGVFVNSTDDFKDHPAVANGASDLVAEILGDNGKHARFAVGSSSLPFNVAVEVDALFEIL